MQTFRFQLIQFHWQPVWLLATAAALLLGVTRGHIQASASPSAVDGLPATTFDVMADGRTIHLLFGWREGKEDPLKLHYLSSTDAGKTWSTPVAVPVNHAPPAGHSRGNDVQITAHGESLLALWTAQGSGPFGSGPIGTALSNDSGKTWRPGPIPRVALEAEGSGYRFPAVAAEARGFHLIWIHAAGEERSLRHSRLPFGADSWSDPVVIDLTACACCWNRLAIDSAGNLFALYRDEEPRDLALSHSSDGGKSWRHLGPVGEFHWDFVGCPHVGGGLAITPPPDGGAPMVWTSVWTGHSEHLGAHVFRSEQTSGGWKHAAQMETLGKTGRHTDIAALSAVEIAVAWDQPSEDDSSVFLMLSEDGGETWNDPKQLSKPGTRSTHPRLTAVQGRLAVFWSEHPEGMVSRLKMAIR